MRLTERWLKKAEEETGRGLIGSYTRAFFFLCLLVFSWYFCLGRALMWKGDSWTQHYKALVYYGRFLRQILLNFLSGHPSVPEFDLAIGEGGDILETLHYYVIGDPFAFFSVLVPSCLMVFYYVLMILLRMYLSGLAFIYLCRYFGKLQEEGRVKSALLGPGAVVGSLVYVFAYWTLLNAARHPYFLNPLIYFPLLVVGVEKVIRKDKPNVFVGTVMIAALSNFYFFYVLALMTGIYTAVRVLYLWRVEKVKLWSTALRLLSWALLGAALAAVTLIPMCRTFLTNGRMDTKNSFRLLYPASYYGKLPSLLLSSGDAYWVCMGFAVPVFIVLCLFLKRKGHPFLKLIMLLCLVMIMFPVFGRAFNGFAYITNRWSWALALVAGLATAVLWNEIAEIDKKEWRILWIAASVYTVLCIVCWNSRTWRSFSAIILLMITIYLVRPGRDRIAVKRSLLTMGAISIALNSFWLNAYVSDSYASKSAYYWDAVFMAIDNEGEDVKRIVRQGGDTEWFRYAGPSIDTNGNLISGVSSTQFYWTIGSPETALYRTLTEQREYSLYKFYEYDGRTALTDLAAVKYYLLKPQDKAAPPYGFERFRDLPNGGGTLYINRNALPIFYTYDSYMPLYVWENLSAVEREAALLRSAVLDDEIDGLKQTEAKDILSYIDETGKERTNRFASPEYTVQCGDGIRELNNGFWVTKKGAEAELLLNGADSEAEVYVTFVIEDLKLKTGHAPMPIGQKLFKKPLDLGPLHFEKPADFRFFATDKLEWKVPDSAEILICTDDGTEKPLVIHNDEYSYFNNRNTFTVNLGYRTGSIKKVKLVFREAGEYYMTVGIRTKKMEGFSESISERKEDNPEITIDRNGTFRAELTVDRPKLLCLAVPYHEGFSVTVNGKKAEVLKTNIGYMGVLLSPGENSVVFSYQRSLGLLGEAVSALAALTCLVLWYRRRKREKKA
ncbi:MAG: YfhO family protein [Lachnospiraceae bacterium]|nr:YfhO family protein [Lachnospiraceae bacterium]